MGKTPHWAASVVCLCLGLSFISAVRAGDKIVAPLDIPGAVKVDAEGVLRLAETLPQLIVIDSRIAVDRKQGYIEGSLSLPDAQTTCATLARRVANKGDAVLFYCNGPKCGRSVVGVRTALQCGYRQVYWFRGGFEEWKQKGFPYLKE
jgi:rhodanese-related sulfurtransferase